MLFASPLCRCTYTAAGGDVSPFLSSPSGEEKPHSLHHKECFNEADFSFQKESIVVAWPGVCPWGFHGVSCLCSWSKFASVSLWGVVGVQSEHSWDLVSQVECSFPSFVHLPRFSVNLLAFPFPLPFLLPCMMLQCKHTHTPGLWAHRV